MIEILLSPLKYLAITHSKKWWVDWSYPLIFALASTAVVFLCGTKGAVAGQDGLLAKILLVCSVLPGFFIAALAAIATFNKPDVDELMPNPAPTVMEEINGKKTKVELTRRRFLCFLFAFLCFESLVLMVVCVFAGLAAKGVVTLMSNFPVTTHTLAVAFVFALLLAFWQMVCITCLGLYYLGNRLHRPTY